MLPPLGPHTPASRIFRINASGTGSAFNRRTARAPNTCLREFPDQRLWHRVRLQSPHRAGRLDNFEQIGGARELLYHGSLLAVNCLDANRSTSLLRSCSLVGTPAMVRLWQDKNESG